MAGGVRSQLAPWLGGASSTPSSGAAAGGARSPLAFWMGGAGATPVPSTSTAGGPRSMLAFWMGGGAGLAGTTPAPDVLTGGRADFGRARRIRAQNEVLIAAMTALIAEGAIRCH